MFEQPVAVKFVNLLKQILSIDDGASKFLLIENVDSHEE
jgi:hypothetical protein